MISPTPVIFVTGFLGAGKTTLAQHLRSQPGVADLRVIEVDGLKTREAIANEFAGHPVRAVIAVADTVNFTKMVEDRLAGPLITAQISAADAVVVTRSDATDPQPTLDALSGLTDRPVLVAPHGDINLADVPTHAGISGPNIDLTAKFEAWNYLGPASLNSEQAEALLERRPKGIYRIWGQVKTDTGGLDLQLIGRARQITKIDSPPETRLHALGPKADFRRFEMDGVFSTYAAASAHLSGLFGHR